VTKQLTVLLLCLGLLLQAVLPVYSADQPVLLELQKKEGLSSTRISLLFDRLPEFSTEHSGQRLDIQLNEATVSDEISHLPEDETVVKILLASKAGGILASFLLRRPPKQIVSKSQENPARIDFDLYWDSARGSRPAVAFRVEGIPGIKGGRKLREKREFPVWHENWRDLFKADLTPWKLDPELNFSLPEFPVLAIENPSPALQQRLELTNEKRWLSLLRFLPDMPPLAENEQLYEELLVIEGMVRTGGLEAAAIRLRKLEDLQGPHKVRVDYLTDFVLAANGQAYAAFLKGSEQLKTLSAKDPFYPLMTLLVAEAAVATSNDKMAVSLLDNKEIAWPGALSRIVSMRRADAIVGLGDYPRALGEYHKLTDSTLLFDSYPKSRGRAAKAAFAVGDYRLATLLYKDLGRQLADQPQEDLAYFAAAAANYNAGETEWAQIGLQKVFLEMPGTEGADRAALRIQDHQVLIGGEREQAEAAYRYAFLAEKSKIRVLREEAGFKQALVLYLLGDSGESVKLLMDFRRAFASGALRAEADSLLAEQLPGVIGDLIDKGEDIAAMVLVEQNRKLLLKGDLDKAFLDRIAGALTRLGLYKRAARIQLFLLDRAKGVAAREEYYMPLVQLYLLRREYRAASDYAKTYLDTYPRGVLRGAVYGLMLDALEKQKRYEELLQQLERSDRPLSAYLDVRAAWLYWQQDRLVDTVKRLESARKLTGKLEVKEMALFAESLYQLGRDKEAEKFFKPLKQDETFGPQASYRSAQLLLRKGKMQAGLNLLRSFVEKDKSGPWVLLAQDLLKEIR
jgi:hypothetical protein